MFRRSYILQTLEIFSFKWTRKPIQLQIQIIMIWSEKKECSLIRIVSVVDVLVTYFNKLPNLFWCRCMHDHKFKHSKRCLLQDYISKLEQFVTLHIWPYYFKHFTCCILYSLYIWFFFLFFSFFVCLLANFEVFSYFCALCIGEPYAAIVTLIWPHHIIIILFILLPDSVLCFAYKEAITLYICSFLEK